jgi:hypothetical protein
MRRTQATDCRTLPFDVAEVYAALLDFENYPAQKRSSWHQLRQRQYDRSPEILVCLLVPLQSDPRLLLTFRLFPSQVKAEDLFLLRHSGQTQIVTLLFAHDNDASVGQGILEASCHHVDRADDNQLRSAATPEGLTHRVGETAGRDKQQHSGAQNPHVTGHRSAPNRLKIEQEWGDDNKGGRGLQEQPPLPCCLLRLPLPFCTWRMSAF